MITCTFNFVNLTQAENRGIVSAIKELTVQGREASDQWWGKIHEFQLKLKDVLSDMSNRNVAYLIITSGDIEFPTKCESSIGTLALYCDSAFIGAECVLIYFGHTDQLNVHIGKVWECFEHVLP